VGQGARGEGEGERERDGKDDVLFSFHLKTIVGRAVEQRILCHTAGLQGREAEEPFRFDDDVHDTRGVTLLPLIFLSGSWPKVI